MSNTHTDQSQVKPKAPKVQELVDSAQSLILATIDAEGNPVSSYAPFALVDWNFMVYLSYMAKHTKNLQDRKKASIMLIEDETASKQIYARTRLTINSEAVLVDKENPLFEQSLNALKERHGKVVEVLSEMTDFVLFELKPKSGAYVNGFGSAYFVDSNLQVIEQNTGEGGGHGHGAPAQKN